MEKDAPRKKIAKPRKRKANMEKRKKKSSPFSRRSDDQRLKGAREREFERF